MSDIPTSPFNAQDDTDGYPPIDHCAHETQEVRRYTASNGAKHFVLQCMTCGQNLRALSANDPRRRELAGAPPDFDTTLAGQYAQDKFDRFAVRRQSYADARAAESASWQERYERYIVSDEWRQKATRRLNFDRSQCQARLDGCLGTATQVHHLSYRHFEREPLFELVSVCRLCHEQITAMDRGAA